MVAKIAEKNESRAAWPGGSQVALNAAQSEMDSASRDNHTIEMQLTKSMEAFELVKEQLRGMGMEV